LERESRDSWSEKLRTNHATKSPALKTVLFLVSCFVPKYEAKDEIRTRLGTETGKFPIMD
jgi:hypothetical protein